MLQFTNRLISLTWDLISNAKPEQILSGQRMFRPFLNYQKSWLTHFYPNDTLNLNKDTWFYLQKYMIPLIKKHASSYHIKGMHRLNLESSQKPTFQEFQDLFYHESKGFTLHPVNKEIEPLEYYSLILQKKFPCIDALRSHEELFCANEPDFWHEAIGHIAPLCFFEVQEFYFQIAEYMLSAKSPLQFEEHLAVAWTITEYAFIKEHDQNKMFGAALVGSHLANMRYLNGYIQVEPATRNSIINSGFYEEHSPIARNENGNLRFFYLDQLNAHPLFKECSLS